MEPPPPLPPFVTIFSDPCPPYHRSKTGKPFFWKANGKLQNIFWYLYDALHKPNHKQMFDTNIWNRYLSFNVLKQNRISLPWTSILFYRQPCFWPQTQICLSRFPVTGSKYAYSMLIYKLIKFCCVPQQSFPIMYKSNLLFLLTSMMQWAVDESNRKRIVWEKWSV